jgi:hypothetical protein
MSDHDRIQDSRAGEREDPRRAGERERPWEGRTFADRGRFNSDEDRYGRGSRDRSYGPEPASPLGRPLARDDALHDQERVGYRDQAYGLEGGRDHELPLETRGRYDDERETWSPADGAPYGDLELNPRTRGIQEFGPPHDYAYHPHAGHEFDPDYLHWRDAQMRAFDREYAEWRRRRLERYDEDYRRLRAEGRER